MAGEGEELSFGGKTDESGAEKPQVENMPQPEETPPIIIRDPNAPQSSAFMRAARDLWAALSNWTLWWRLSMLDIRSRYRRTMIGPFWNVLSVAILVASLGTTYSVLWGVDLQEFLPFFAAGYVTWVFITGSMNEHSGSFISGANMIQSMTMPITLHIVRPLFRNILIFFHALTVYIVTALIFRPEMDNPLSLLLAPVGLLILSANLLWIGLVLAILCARYRDFIQVVTSVLQVAFFVTPIFWRREFITDRPNGEIADFILATCNPFFHLVEVLRGPLIGDVPEPITYIITITAAIIGLVFSVFILGRSRGRIAYWV